MVRWFKQTDKKFLSTGPHVRSEAKEFVSCYGITILCRAGWLNGFKENNSIYFTTVCVSVNAEAMNVWKSDLLPMISDRDAKAL